MSKISAKKVKEAISQVEQVQTEANKFKKNVFTEDVWNGQTATAASTEFDSKIIKSIEKALEDLETLQSKITVANQAIENYEEWQRLKRKLASANDDGGIHLILKSKVESAKRKYENTLKLI